LVLQRKLAPNLDIDGHDATINERMMAPSRMKVNAATLRVSQRNTRSPVPEFLTRCGDVLDAEGERCAAPIDWVTSAVGSDAM
jgi:hypothetical protein